MSDEQQLIEQRNANEFVATYAKRFEELDKRLNQLETKESIRVGEILDPLTRYTLSVSPIQVVIFPVGPSVTTSEHFTFDWYWWGYNGAGGASTIAAVTCLEQGGVTLTQLSTSIAVAAGANFFGYHRSGNSYRALTQSVHVQQGQIATVNPTTSAVTINAYEITGIDPVLPINLLGRITATVTNPNSWVEAWAILHGLVE